MTDEAVMHDPAPQPATNLGKLTREWRKVPPQRRQDKRIMTLLGILLLELSFAGAREWQWPAWGWGSCLFFGGHFAAGDHRRLIVNAIVAALKDAAELAGQLAAAAKAIRNAVLAALGRNGNDA